MASILVVDDESTIRRLLALTVDPAHEIWEASDGAEALEHLRRARPDLVLLDVAMPGMGGLEVCRAIRGDPTFDGVGIIVLSAYARCDDALAAGADRYFGKPFGPLALLHAIDDVLALRGGGAGVDRRGPTAPAR